MLILTRKIHEVLCIGKDVTIEILSIDKKNQVRIGISAPLDVDVDRYEIRVKKDANRGIGK